MTSSSCYWKWKVQPKGFNKSVNLFQSQCSIPIPLENVRKLYCVKIIRIWSYSSPYSPAFRLNTERYPVFSDISRGYKNRTLVWYWYEHWHWYDIGMNIGILSRYLRHCSNSINGKCWRLCSLQNSTCIFERIVSK